VQKAPLAAVAAAAKDRQPLLDLVVSITMQFIEERQSRSISRDDALVLLEEQQLLVEPELTASSTRSSEMSRLTTCCTTQTG
jgi:hypothetical protein